MCALIFIAALLTTAWTQEAQVYPSINEQIKDKVPFTMVYYSARKNKELNIANVTTWMNPGVYENEMSGIKRHILYDFSYIWNITNKTNE